MRRINGIDVDEGVLNSLKDKGREGPSTTYFFGTVMEISLAQKAPDIYRIWQEARSHLYEVYKGSIYAEEDFFVFDVGLARSVRQRAQLLGLPKEVAPRREIFTSLEKQEMAGIYDEQRKTMAKICFMDAIEAMEAAGDARELIGIGELFDVKMEQIYQGSEFKRRELWRWLNMLGRRLLENSGRFKSRPAKK